jgi:hypothetical protein
MRESWGSCYCKRGSWRLVLVCIGGLVNASFTPTPTLAPTSTPRASVVTWHGNSDAFRRRRYRGFCLFLSRMITAVLDLFPVFCWFPWVPLTGLDLVHLSSSILFPCTVYVLLDLSALCKFDTFRFLSFLEGLLIGLNILSDAWDRISTTELVARSLFFSVLSSHFVPLSVTSVPLAPLRLVYP